MNPRGIWKGMLMCTLPWERHMVAELILSSAAENPTSSNRLLGRWSFCAYFSLRGWPFPQFVLPLCYLLSYVSANSVTNPPGNTVLASDDEILEKQLRVSFRHTGMEITVLVSCGHRRAGSSWASALPCDGTPELTARSHAATPRHWTLISLRGAQGYKLLLHQRDCFFFLSIDKKGKREKSTARDASAVPMPHVSPSFPGAAIRPSDPRAAACAEGAPNAIAADREAAGGARLRAAVSTRRSRPPGGPTEQLPRAARRMPLTCWFLGRTPSGQRRVMSPCGGRRSRLRARRAPASVLLLVLHAAGWKAGGRLTASAGNFRVSPSSPKSSEVGGLSRPRCRLRPAAPRSAPGTPSPAPPAPSQTLWRIRRQSADLGERTEEGRHLRREAATDHIAHTQTAPGTFRLGTAVLVSHTHAHLPFTYVGVTEVASPSPGTRVYGLGRQS